MEYKEMSEKLSKTRLAKIKQEEPVQGVSYTKIHTTGEGKHIFAELEAIQNLSSSGFIVYRYFIRNHFMPFKTVASYPNHVLKGTGYLMEEFNEIIPELIERGYLEYRKTTIDEDNISHNWFDFYESLELRENNK